MVAYTRQVTHSGFTSTLLRRDYDDAAITPSTARLDFYFGALPSDN